MNKFYVQLNQYETAPNFIQLNRKLDIGLFVDLAEITCFYQFLHDVIIELFHRQTKQFYDHNMQELVKTGKFS